ncbi:MAG: 3-dehydroquinate synthase [Candidatus Firestonebacteria bacterium]
MPKIIKISLKTKTDRSYNLVLGNNILPKLGAAIKKLNCGSSIFIITDKNVARFYLKKTITALKKGGFSDIGKAVIPAGEKQKNFNTYLKLLNALYEFDKNQQKKVVLLTLGGGVVGDLGGFIAGTYRRGVNYIQVPTTLLGLVDCGLGGKTAFNFREAKNLIGAFWQPKMVYMDTAVLKTLPLRELKCGLAEAIKYGVIKDKQLFSFFEKNIKKLLNYDKAALNKMIPVCAGIKAKITSADERDNKDIRIILNYGHTLGHAIEAATNYKKFRHGEAIAIGMVLAAKLAVKLGCLSSCDAARIKALIRKAGLPVSAKGINPKKILVSMKRDKKFVAGVNRFILPAGIGKVRITENIPENLILNVLL